MLKVAWEPLDTLLDDGMTDLVHEHWLEVGVHRQEMPVAVDWERYRQLEEKQILSVLAARLDGGLIGYAAFFYLPHLHYNSTQLAACDAIFVRKTQRKTGAGLRLIEMAETEFKARAAPDWVRITYHDRVGIELLGPVLRKRGYIATDTTYGIMTRT